METSFTVPGKPQGKARAKVVLRGNRVHAFTPDKTVLYENYIKLCFKSTQQQFFSNKPLKLSVKAVYPIPKGFGLKKTKQALDGIIRPCVKPDMDNVIKVVADALNNVAYTDDKNIVEMCFSKFYGEEPRLEIRIEEL